MRRRGNGASLVALALAGSFLAACGGEAEQEAAQDTARIPPEPGVLAQETQALKRRVGSLEDQLEQQSAQQQTLDSRLAAVDARLAAVEGGLGLGQDGDGARTAAVPRLDDLEKRLERVAEEASARQAASADQAPRVSAEDISLDDVQSVVITDAQGQRGVISASQFRDMMAEAVGERVSAELERRLGSRPREYRVLPAAPNEIEGFEPADPARPEVAQDEQRYAAHLGSYRHMDRMLTGLERLRDKHVALQGLPVSAADITMPEKGDFLRLLVGTFEAFDQAVALCETVSREGDYCEVRRLRSVPRMAGEEDSSPGEGTGAGMVDAGAPGQGSQAG